MEDARFGIVYVVIYLLLLLAYSQPILLFLPLYSHLILKIFLLVLQLLSVYLSQKILLLQLLVDAALGKLLVCV